MTAHNIEISFKTVRLQRNFYFVRYVKLGICQLWRANKGRSSGLLNGLGLAPLSIQYWHLATRYASPRWVRCITLSRPAPWEHWWHCTTFVSWNPISIHLLGDRVSSDWPVSTLCNHRLVCTQDEGCSMMPRHPACHHCTPWDCQSVCLVTWTVDTHQHAIGSHYTWCSYLKLSKRISFLNSDST